MDEVIEYAVWGQKKRHERVFKSCRLKERLTDWLCVVHAIRGTTNQMTRSVAPDGNARAKTHIKLLWRARGWFCNLVPLFPPTFPASPRPIVSGKSGQHTLYVVCSCVRIPPPPKLTVYKITKFYICRDIHPNCLIVIAQISLHIETQHILL